MIRKLPNKNKWIVKSETTGRSFGTFNKKGLAVKRLKQIEYFKLNKRSKK